MESRRSMWSASKRSRAASRPARGRAASCVAGRKGRYRLARIAIGGMQHETNTFAPSKADYPAFEAGGGWPSIQYGDPLFDAVAGANIPAQGAIEALRSSGHSLVATTWASASPSAHVTSEAFERIVGELVSRLQAAGKV